MAGAAIGGVVIWKMAVDRIRKLKEFLARDGEDSFSLYALAMEYASRGRFEESLEYFDRLLRTDPEHVPGYHQKAKVLAQLGRYVQARAVLEAGVPHAQRSGQFHTRDKMAEMLRQLPTRDGEGKEGKGS